MNEVNIDKNKQLGEILKLARLALNEEYLKKHQERHQEWRVACDQMWLTKGMLLPYTSPFEYPTDQDIINRAVKIYNTLHPDQPTPATQEATVAEPEAILEAEVVPETPVEEVPAEEILAPVETVPTETVLENTKKYLIAAEPTPTPGVGIEDKFKSLFTKWGGRGSLPEDIK
ncbi:hypothetical protein UFOVP71_318 [uncultured Caudovirales phage]|uniref:Uncharacterized protein n=1 Tax=uncultured Caudovirales phage TaxID=2100421 RepID=A0A6J5TDQ3_9CAUD|nr:hypothetical protein UFOVP71_318 [uncultured Caudovirales phage]